MVRTFAAFAIAIAASACAAADSAEPVHYRFEVNNKDRPADKRLPRYPLVDIPRRYVGEPPELVKDLYLDRIRKDDDGRLVVGYAYITLDAQEIGSAGEPMKGQLSVIPKDLWPKIIMETVAVARSEYPADFDPVLQLNKQRRVAVTPRADVYFYSDPEAKDFVWIQCRYDDADHIGPEDPGRCNMHLMPVDYVAVMFGFEAKELPLWRQRADRLRTLVRGWTLPESDWPVVTD